MLKTQPVLPSAIPALAGMLAIASSLSIGRFVYTPILPAMIDALGMSRATAGLIASANFAGYLAGALVVTLRLPGGPRPWFVGALLVGAASTLAMAGADGVAAFLLLRFAGGAASAFVLVLGTAAVLDALARSGRPGFRAMHYAGVGLGIAVSAVGIAWLQAERGGWRVEWLAAGVVAACMLPLPIAALRPVAPAEARPAERVRIDGKLLTLSLCHGLFGFGYIVTATFLVTIVRGSAPSLEPTVWAVVGLTAIPSTILWDRLGTRLGPLPAYALAFVVEAIGVLAGGAWPTAAGALLAAVLLGGTFMGLTALGFAAARAMGSAGQARRFAVITAGFGLGQVIGPVAGGALADRTGNFAAASVLAAAALAVGAALAVALARRQVQ